ncbi:hypothetical protein Tco_0915798 [Tanacetum coccineum]
MCAYKVLLIPRCRNQQGGRSRCILDSVLGLLLRLHGFLEVTAAQVHNGDLPLSLCEGEDSPLSLGKRCEKNYLSVRRYVADPDNAYPKRSITKLILKGAVIFDVVSYQFRCALNYSKLLLKLLNQEYVARIRGKLIQKLLLNQKCMGYLVRAYYSISPTKYYKDDSCWSADLKSNTTEDGEAKTTPYEKLWGRPTAASKNHMISSYDVLIIQNIRVILRQFNDGGVGWFLIPADSHRSKAHIHKPAPTKHKDIMKAQKFNRLSFRETPKVLMQAWDKFFEIKHAQSEEVQELFSKLLQDLKSINEELAEYINTPSCNLPTSSYDDDDDEESSIPLKDIIISGLPPCVAITPVLLTEEPVDSLIIEDEHLDTIPATELDEVIKYSVEDLVPIPSESEGIPDKMCDVPFGDNSLPLDISKDQFEGFSDSNDDSTSIDDDSFFIDDIDYVEASPPDSELVSLEEVKDFHTEDGEIEDDILREKLSKINLLIVKIEAINSNQPPSSDFVTKSPSIFLNFFLEETNTFDNSLPESETFCFNLEEKSSGSTTILSDYSLPDYEAFYLDDDHIEEKSSGSTTTHANFSHIINKIFDLGIFIGIQSKIFISRDAFSISFIRDPLFLVIDTLLPFSSENEDKVVNTGILAAGEEQSPHLSSHRGLKALNESPMMISRGDIPILDVPFLHFYPP